MYFLLAADKRENEKTHNADSQKEYGWRFRNLGWWWRFAGWIFTSGRRFAGIHTFLIIRRTRIDTDGRWMNRWIQGRWINRRIFGHGRRFHNDRRFIRRLWCSHRNQISQWRDTRFLNHGRPGRWSRIEIRRRRRCIAITAMHSYTCSAIGNILIAGRQ